MVMRKRSTPNRRESLASALSIAFCAGLTSAANHNKQEIEIEGWPLVCAGVVATGVAA
jgi:hypothetical protein